MAIAEAARDTLNPKIRFPSGTESRRTIFDIPAARYFPASAVAISSNTKPISEGSINIHFKICKYSDGD